MAKRKSRAKQPIDWDDLFRKIEAGIIGEIPIPAHLSTAQMRDMVEEIAKKRGIAIELRITLGHLDIVK